MFKLSPPQQQERHDNAVNSMVTKHVNNIDWKTIIETENIISLPGTTGPGVPGKVRSWLLSTGVPIDNNAQDHFGSELAVKAMEEKVCEGWDTETNNFGNTSCVHPLGFGPYRQELPTKVMRTESNDADAGSAKNEITLDPSEIDIVTPSIRNLDFLNEWREFFQGELSYGGMVICDIY